MNAGSPTTSTPTPAIARAELGLRVSEALCDMEPTVRDALLYTQVLGFMVEEMIVPNHNDRQTLLTDQQAEMLAFITYRTARANQAVVDEWEAANTLAFEARR